MNHVNPPEPSASHTTHRSTLRFLFEGLEGLVLAAIILLTWPVSKRWLASWGSSPAERSRTWPGDRLAPSAVEIYTRAIAIRAPAEAIWPWVAQLGLDRAGFYSYELLERLVGIPVRNLETILPELQGMALGSELKLHPKAPGVPVGALEAGRHVCFGDAGELSADTPDPRRSWSIYIETESPTESRLLLRSCIEELRAPTLAKRLGLAIDAPIDFTMEQRMLRTIRRLAEAHAGSRGGDAQE